MTAATPVVGTEIDRVWRVEQVRHGAHGDVYLCAGIGRAAPAALKAPSRSADERKAFARFRRECTLLARLPKHNNVAPLLQVGRLPDTRPYVALVRMPEPTFSFHGLLESGNICCSPFRYRSALVLRAIAGVAHLHQHGVLHLDISPGNVLFSNNAGVLLIDLSSGHAAGLEPPPSVATNVWTAPERSRGDSIVDARLDVYSLGYLALSLLTGRQLPDDIVRSPTRHAIAEELAIVPQRRRLAVADLFSSMLSHTRDRRPADATEALHAWRRATEGCGAHDESTDPCSATFDYFGARAVAAWTGEDDALTITLCTDGLVLAPPSKDESYAALLSLRGQAHVRRGEYGLALRDLEGAAAKNPASALIWCDLGTARRHAGDRGGARAAYARALQLDPSLSHALSALQDMNNEDRRPGAHQAPPQTNRDWGHDPMLALPIVRAHLLAGEHDRACQMLTDILDSGVADEDAAAVHFMIARLDLLKRDWPSARGHLEAAVGREKLDTNTVYLVLIADVGGADGVDADVVALLGSMVRFDDEAEQREWRQLIDPALEAAFDSRPARFLPFYVRGAALSRAGRWRGAARYFQRALELCPDNLVVSNDAVLPLQRLGRYEAVMRLTDRTLRLHPEGRVPHANRAVALNALGRYAEALKALREATQLEHELALKHNSEVAEASFATAMLATQPTVLDDFALMQYVGAQLRDARRDLDNGEAEAAIEAIERARPGALTLENGQIPRELQDLETLARELEKRPRPDGSHDHHFEAGRAR